MSNVTAFSAMILKSSEKRKLVDIMMSGESFAVEKEEERAERGSL